jgi:hypothetical protein
MDLSEGLIKGIDGQSAHLDELHHDLFGHFQNEFLFRLHHPSPKRPPPSGRRLFFEFSGGPYSKKNPKRHSLMLNLADYAGNINPRKATLS